MTLFPERINILFRSGSILIFLVAFATRLAILFIEETRMWTPQGAEVLNIARSLANKQGFRDAYGADSGPTAHTTPLYPLLVAGVLAIADDDAIGSAVVRILTSAAAALACSMLPHLSVQFGFTRAAGLWAGLVGALIPYGRLDTEGTFENVFGTSLFFMYIYVLYRLIDKHCIIVWDAFRVGLAGGLIVLTGASFFPGVAAMIVDAGRRNPILRSLKNTAVIICGFVLVITPWIYRNVCAFGKLIPLRGNFWLEVALSNQAGAAATLEENMRKGIHQRYHPLTNPEELELYRRIGEVEYMLRKKAMATEWICKNREQFLKLSINRIASFFFFPHRSRVLTLTLSAIAIGALIGTWLPDGNSARSSDRVWLWVLVISFSMIHLLVQVSLRYRYPAHLLMLIPFGHLLHMVAKCIAGKRTLCH